MNSVQQVPLSVIIVTAIFVAIIVGGFYLYVRADFIKHKKPLQEIDPNVKYTLAHHVKVVTVPLLKYRITFLFSRKP